MANNFSLPRQQCNGIAYYQGGTGGATLLFLHGVGLSADCWQQQISVLEQQNTVFAVDLPGHGASAVFGNSDDGNNSIKITDFSDKIAEFIATKIGKPVIVVGHSLGALITLQLAADHPQHLSAAVAISAVFCRSQQAQHAVAARATQLQQATDAIRHTLIDSTIARWFGQSSQSSEHAQAAEQCRDWLRQTPAAAYATAYQVFANTAAEQIPLAQLTRPVLYLTGADDPNSTAEMSKQMAAQTPNAEAMIIAGHAHLLQMTAATAVCQALQQGLLSFPDCTT